MKRKTIASDSEGEIATLKALLKETLKTNKRLKKQNRRQQQVGYFSPSIRFPAMAPVSLYLSKCHIFWKLIVTAQIFIVCNNQRINEKCSLIF